MIETSRFLSLGTEACALRQPCTPPISTAEAHFADFSFISSRTVFPFAPSPVLTRPFGMFDPLVRLADLQRLDRVYAEMARAIDATTPSALPSTIRASMIAPPPRLGSRRCFVHGYDR